MNTYEEIQYKAFESTKEVLERALEVKAKIPGAFPGYKYFLKCKYKELLGQFGDQYDEFVRVLRRINGV